MAASLDASADAIEQMTSVTPIELDDFDRTVLQAMANERQPMQQVDLAALLDDARCVRSLRPRLKAMRDAGLIHRPRGERGGDAITEAGKKVIELPLTAACLPLTAD